MNFKSAAAVICALVVCGSAIKFFDFRNDRKNVHANFDIAVPNSKNNVGFHLFGVAGHCNNVYPIKPIYPFSYAGQEKVFVCR